MINCKLLRTMYRKTINKPKHLITKCLEKGFDLMGFMVLILTILAIMALLTCFAHASSTGHPGVNDSDAVLTIIGEAEGENLAGKLAIAKTILNRGTLKGCYGLKAKRVINHKYSHDTYEDAEQMWELASITHGKDGWTATGWGSASDIVIFKHQGWFKHCVIVAHVGGHYFYRKA